MNPDTPPMTNSRMVEEKNKKAVVMTGLPSQIVASQANTATAEGNTIAIEAPEKNDRPSPGRPVAGGGGARAPGPGGGGAAGGRAAGEGPTSGRRRNTGRPADTRPRAGS